MSQLLLGGFFAVLLRAAGFLWAAPLTSALPARLRLGAAALLALGIAPGRAPLPLAELPLVAPLELTLGLLTGFTARLALAGAETGGQLIGLSLGLGLRDLFHPGGEASALAGRKLVLALAGLAFVGAGGITRSVQAIAVAPVSPQLLQGALGQMLAGSGAVLVAGLRFAAPALLAAVSAQLGAGLVARAVPGLDPFAVTLAALVVLVGLVLLVSAPLLVEELAGTGRWAVELVTAGGRR